MTTSPRISPGFAENLRQMREDLGLTAAQVENITGVSRQTLSAIENRKQKNPGFVDIARLVGLYGGSLDELAYRPRDLTDYERRMVRLIERHLSANSAEIGCSALEKLESKLRENGGFRDVGRESKDRNRIDGTRVGHDNET